MKYLIDKDGNVFKAHVISSIPNGFKDISDAKIDEDAKKLRSEYIEAIEISEVPAIEGAIEHWTNGINAVYNANDIPTLIDENNDAYLDPSYNYINPISAKEKISAHYRIKKTSQADQELRQIKINKLKELRKPLLVEADIVINILADNGEDTVSHRVYRQALRDITEPYKKVNGNWKVAVDSLIIEEFIFPSKPQ